MAQWREPHFPSAMVGTIGDSLAASLPKDLPAAADAYDEFALSLAEALFSWSTEHVDTFLKTLEKKYDDAYFVGRVSGCLAVLRHHKSKRSQ